MPHSLEKAEADATLLTICFRFVFWVAERQVLQQALLFGGMAHRRSQFYAMHVDPDGGQRVHLQTTPPCMPVQTLLILWISKFLK